MAKYSSTASAEVLARVQAQRMIRVVTNYNRMRGYITDFIRRSAETFPDGMEVIYRSGSASTPKCVGTVVRRAPTMIEDLDGLTVITDGEEYQVPWHRIEGPAASALPGQ